MVGDEIVAMSITAMEEKCFKGLKRIENIFKDGSGSGRVLWTFLVTIVMAGTAVMAGEREIPPGEQVAFGGVIITTGGLVVSVHEFLSPLKDTCIQGQENGKIRRIRPSELKEILLLEPGCPYGIYLHGISGGCRLWLTVRTGETIRLTDADFTPRNIEQNGLVYEVLNRVTGRRETRALWPAEIGVIRIGPPVARPGE